MGGFVRGILVGEPEREVVKAEESSDVIWIELISVSWILPCLEVVSY